MRLIKGIAHSQMWCGASGNMFMVVEKQEYTSNQGEMAK